jgi:hypothetical protein
MAKFTFNYENIDVTIDFLHADLQEDYNGMNHHITSLTYQIMVYNHLTSTEDEKNYYFVGRNKTDVPPADSNSYIPINEINYEIFVPVIKEEIIQNENTVHLIKKYGSLLGLCEEPEPLHPTSSNVAKLLKTSQTKPQYTPDGFGVIRI